MDSSPKNENYVIIYSPSSSSKPVRMSLFCRTQRKIFWRKFVTRLFWGTIDFHIRNKKYYGSQWCPRTALFPTFFRISSFVFSRTKTFIQVWNYLRVSKLWQNFHFWVNYPFKGLLTQNISNTPYQSATNNNRWIYFQEKLTYGSMSITQIFPLAKTSLTASMLVP